MTDPIPFTDNRQPIGVFDSGYGGLTVFKSLVSRLPQYDYVYLGDNGRTPYGNRSFETVHQYTLECVKELFSMGCPLVILACNTASAKALRTIQQKYLPLAAPDKRVLGVIRPTAEVIGKFSSSDSIGVLGTRGTVLSGSYPLEIAHFYPNMRVHQLACPMWVPLVENGEADSPGADYFVKKYLDQLKSEAPDIDAVLLACTHYPLLMNKIRAQLPDTIRVIAQGDIVAESLENYLRRHPEMESRLSKNGRLFFYTTDSTVDFDQQAARFFGKTVHSRYLNLDKKS